MRDARMHTYVRACVLYDVSIYMTNAHTSKRCASANNVYINGAFVNATSK